MIQILFLMGAVAQAETALPQLDPKLGGTVDLSKKRIRQWKKAEAIMNKAQDPAKLSTASQKIIDESGYDEMSSGPWSTIDEGCSWYCGGGPEKFSASSQLASQGKNSYDPKFSHDFDLRTAWVEGDKGNGEGESLLFHFPGNSKKADDILIYNGYQKSPKHFKDNGRVKKFKLFINEKPVAILNLKDSRASQKFSVDKLYSMGEGQALIMRLEIAEVYPGKKWKDTAISEINFDGSHSH